MWFMFVIPFIIFFVIFLSIVGSFFKSHHKVGDIKLPDVDTIFDTVSAYAEKQVENLPKLEQEQVCEYCGSTVKTDETKCMTCRTKIKIKK